MQNYINVYLIYCEKLKNLDYKTLKAYKIDLNQFFEFINGRKQLQFDKESINESVHLKISNAVF